MDISNDPCVSQMQEGIVDSGMVRGRRVENGKLSIMRGRAIEVCMGEEMSMERGTIDRGEFQTFSLQCNTIPNGMIPDESYDFFLSILVDKDKGVVARVVSIIFIPSFSRMDYVFLIAHRHM